MQKYLPCLLGVVFIATAHGQERFLPADFRQHSLTRYNSSLFNASFGQNWDRPNSLSLWTRWQWQDIDSDPSSLFVDYLHQIDADNSFGVGFLQHNTGIFLHTGGNLNFTHGFAINGDVRILAGINMFGFQRNVADEQFLGEGETDPGTLESHEGFRTEFSPGFQLLVHRLSIGLAFENAFGFHFSGQGEREYFQNITGSLGNDFPLPWFSGGEDNFFRPVAYLRTIQGGEAQFGLNGLLSTSKFWVQGGYNSFYGLSGGLGVTLARSISIGGLVEFNTDSSLDVDSPSLEILASYRFGPTDQRRKVVGFEREVEEEVALERKAMEREKRRELMESNMQRRRDSLAESQRLAARAREALKRDSLAKASQERYRDSLELVENRRLRDSLAAAQTQKVEPRPDERFEEMRTVDGLEPGFYLIANVFGTKRYFDAFMKSLADKGLNPKSFYRSSNKFNYVYLERYDTMDAAREARDSGFFGKYAEQTWIFRLRGD